MKKLFSKDKREGVYAGYKKLGPTSRLVFHIAIISLVLAVVGCIVSVYYNAQSKRDTKNLANITRSRPAPFIHKFPIIIEDGSNMQTVCRPGRYPFFIKGCPFSFFITKDGCIEINGAIRDETGCVVVEGVGNAIRSIQTDKYDINSDDKAIEVVDINQRPIFQLKIIPYSDFMTIIKEREVEHVVTKQEWLKMRGILDVNVLLTEIEQRFKEKLEESEVEEVIQLYYVTKQEAIWRVSSPNGIYHIENLEEDQESLLPRLFCYPGYSYPGKRVN